MAINITGSWDLTGAYSASLGFYGTASFATSASIAATASFFDLGVSAVAGFTGSTWTFDHNLNRDYVIIDVYDDSDEEIIPQTIDLTTSNQAVISFPVSVQGTAVASLGNGVTVGNITNVTQSVSQSVTQFVNNNPTSTLSTFASTGSYVQELVITTGGIYTFHVSESGAYLFNCTGLAASSASLNIFFHVDSPGFTASNTGAVVVFTAQSGSGTFASFRSIATGSNSTEYFIANPAIGGNTATVARSATRKTRNVPVGVAQNPVGIVRYNDGTLAIVAPNTAIPGTLFAFTGSNGTPIV